VVNDQYRCKLLETILCVSNEGCLVVAYGSIRGTAYAWDSLKEFVLDAHKCDLALLVGRDGNNSKKSLWNMAKYKWTVPERKDWGSVFKEFGTDWHSLFAVPDAWLGGLGCDSNCVKRCQKMTNRTCKSQPGSAGLLLAFRHMIYKKLKKMRFDKKYKHFILTRTDHLHGCKHPDIRDMKLAAAFGQDYGGITDRHWVIRYDYFERYLGFSQELFGNAK